MRATGSNRSGCTKPSGKCTTSPGFSSSSRSTVAAVISARCVPALTAIVQVKVAEIDDQTEPLAEDEHRVVAVHRIDRQHHPAGDAEVPEGDRHDHALFLLARPPLHHEAHHEQALAAETHSDPDQGLPAITQHRAPPQ